MQRAIARLRHRLLHVVLQQPRRRGAPGAARAGAVAGHRREAVPSPTRSSFTLQGDGDMVNEGLQEVLHTAARG